jgi:TolB-like protein/Flp pilus assembly protein TadD
LAFLSTRKKKELAIKFPRFIRQFITEIRRREVIPVVVTYAVVGWLVLQVAGLTFEPLGLPEWGIRVLIIITIAGFPAVFFLAWLIDFKSQGMMFDLPLWPAENKAIETNTSKKSSQLLAAFMCLLVIAGSGGLVVVLLDKFPDSKAQIVISPDDTSKQNSIAVLAFDNFYGQGESDYFAAGLAEEILNFLADMRELNVAARSSSFRFQGEKVDVREIAKLLTVKHVLEGSVRRDGNRIRITVQLIDGTEGYNIWNKTYDRELDDVFAIQQEIASAVVNELKIVLSMASETRLQEAYSENIDAYIYYLQGREKLRGSKDADVMNTAKQLFNQALSIDSNYARAFAGLCEANLRLYEISNGIDDFTTAQEACDRAQELNQNSSSEVKVALGRLYRFRGWYEKSVAQLNDAISISPTSADAYIELGEVLLVQNNIEEAKVELLRAVDLKRNYWKAHEALANFYYMTEDYEKSVKAYQVVTLLTPDSAVGFAGLGSAYWMIGDTKRALSAYESSLQLKPSRQAFTNLGTSYYYAGKFEKSTEMQNQALLLAPYDHRVWGRLAESYRFIPEKQNESKQAYQRAAELALNNLTINNEDWLTRAMLGLYYMFLDRTTEGLELIEVAVAQSQRNPEILYFQALALLQMDKEEEAINVLQEAVELEAYYRQFIAQDPDLQRLKDQSKFKSLLLVSGSK